MACAPQLNKHKPNTKPKWAVAKGYCLDRPLLSWAIRKNPMGKNTCKKYGLRLKVKPTTKA